MRAEWPVSNGTVAARALHIWDSDDGMAIFEGDIVLGSVDEMERLVAEVNKEKDTKAVIVTGAQFRWPGGVVPFTIDPELPNQGRVNDAIAHWNSRTGIRLVARTNEQNFVTFRPGDGCSSSVGMNEGKKASRC